MPAKRSGSGSEVEVVTLQIIIYNIPKHRDPVSRGVRLSYIYIYISILQQTPVYHRMIPCMI